MWASIRQKLAEIYEIAEGPNRIQSLEGVRGFAVALVFCVHYHALFGRMLPTNSAAYIVSDFLGSIGHSGVDLFFVLSGYLIYDRLLNGRPAGYWSFCRRRVRRIYPAFLAVFAVHVLYGFANPARPEMSAGPLATGIYLLQNAALMPGIFDIQPLVTVSWSLSYEILFYCTLPLVVAAFRMRAWKSGQRCVFFLGVALLYAGLHLMFRDFRIVPLRLSPTAHPRMCLFIVGILILEAQHSFWKGRMNRAGEGGALGALVAGFAMYYLTRTNPWMIAHLQTSISQVAVLSFGFFGAMLYSFAFSGFFSRIFSWAPLRWLGNMSYSYFLVHSIALHLLLSVVTRIALPTDVVLFQAALLAIAVLSTVALSTVLFLVVEKPLSLSKAAPKPSSFDRFREGRPPGI